MRGGISSFLVSIRSSLHFRSFGVRPDRRSHTTSHHTLTPGPAPITPSLPHPCTNYTITPAPSPLHPLQLLAVLVVEWVLFIFGQVRHHPQPSPSTPHTPQPPPSTPHTPTAPPPWPDSKPTQGPLHGMSRSQTPNRSLGMRLQRVTKPYRVP